MKEISQIRVTFDEKIKVSTFTIDDVVALEGPLGSIAVDSVAVVPGSYSRKFDVTFAEQAELGRYTLDDRTGHLGHVRQPHGSER